MRPRRLGDEPARRCPRAKMVVRTGGHRPLRGLRPAPGLRPQPQSPVDRGRARCCRGRSRSRRVVLARCSARTTRIAAAAPDPLPPAFMGPCARQGAHDASGHDRPGIQDWKWASPDVPGVSSPASRRPPTRGRGQGAGKPGGQGRKVRSGTGQHSSLTGTARGKVRRPMRRTTCSPFPWPKSNGSPYHFGDLVAGLLRARA